jgi:hypothetical protein
MLVDAMRELHPIAELAEYRYVGFGGLEFVDFELVHRQLGIDDMVSIEKDSANHDRYVANRPFATIDVLGGYAANRLLDLKWDGLNIVWLDYESQLTEAVINDTKLVCGELIPGSLFLVTLNALSPPENDRIATMNANVPGRLPADIDNNDQLAQWGWANAQRRIVDSVVKRVMTDRGDRSWFHQLFDFHYKDSIPMQTWGGIVMAKAIEKPLDSARFDGERLEFIVERNGKPFEVELPVLTEREVIALNQQLPQLVGAGSGLVSDGLTKGQLETFGRVYRWFKPE